MVFGYGYLLFLVEDHMISDGAGRSFAALRMAVPSSWLQRCQLCQINPWRPQSYCNGPKMSVAGHFLTLGRRKPIIIQVPPRNLLVSFRQMICI